MNKRNKHNVKDSIDCYLTVKGILFEQWTDDSSVDIKEERKEFPKHKFIRRHNRIYRSAKEIL